MEDSDDEDLEYTKSLQKHGYHSVDSNSAVISFSKFQNSASYYFNMATSVTSECTKFDAKDVYPIFTQILTHNRLLVCYDSNKFLIHNMSTNNLVQFSKSILKSFPVNYLSRYNRIYGCLEVNQNKLLLYTHYTYIKVDMEIGVPEFSKIGSKDSEKKDTRVMNWTQTVTHFHQKYMEKISGSKNNKTGKEEANPDKEENFKIENKFKGIMFMGKVPDGSMLVIENLWKNLVDKLPGVLKVHKFGQ